MGPNSPKAKHRKSIRSTPLSSFQLPSKDDKPSTKDKLLQIFSNAKEHIRKHKVKYGAALWLALAVGATQLFKSEPTIEHVVKPRETISMILRNYNILPTKAHIEHFKKINDLESDFLRPTQVVRIPLKDTIGWEKKKLFPSNKNKKINNEDVPIDGFDYAKRYKSIEEKDTLLSDYYFVIDPGHGWNDPWAHGTVNWHHFREANATRDLGLRLIKWLKENGACKIIPTRINTMQGIDDGTLPHTTGLPWAKDGNCWLQDEVRDFDIDGINHKDNLNKVDNASDNEGHAARLAKRNRISNKAYDEAHKHGKKLIYIALHLDAWESMGVLFQPGDTKSHVFAQNIIENWFVRTYNGKVMKIPSIKSKSLQVLRESKKDQWILIEFCDITKNESRKMRNAENRQQVIESLVQSIVKTLGK